MKVGDLFKIYPKDGAASFEVGVYLGEEKFKTNKRDPTMVHQGMSFWVKSPVFLVNGQKKTYCKIDYNFEIMKKD